MPLLCDDQASDGLVAIETERAKIRGKIDPLRHALHDKLRILVFHMRHETLDKGSRGDGGDLSVRAGRLGAEEIVETVEPETVELDRRGTTWFRRDEACGQALHAIDMIVVDMADHSEHDRQRLDLTDFIEARQQNVLPYRDGVYA